MRAEGKDPENVARPYGVEAFSRDELRFLVGSPCKLQIRNYKLKILSHSVTEANKSVSISTFFGTELAAR